MSCSLKAFESASDTPSRLSDNKGKQIDLKPSWTPSQTIGNLSLIISRWMLLEYNTLVSTTY